MLNVAEELGESSCRAVTLSKSTLPRVKDGMPFDEAVYLVEDKPLKHLTYGRTEEVQLDDSH